MLLSISYLWILQTPDSFYFALNKQTLKGEVLSNNYAVYIIFLWLSNTLNESVTKLVLCFERKKIQNLKRSYFCYFMKKNHGYSKYLNFKILIVVIRISRIIESIIVSSKKSAMV